MTQDVLNAAVRAATGLAKAEARPGQARLFDNIVEQMEAREHLSGSAPTGVGKSLSYLVPAAIAAVTRGERTVVSTESLALQAQIVDKDGPAVQAALIAELGSAPKIAVLKGWSNYACSLRSYTRAMALLEACGVHGVTNVAAIIAELDELVEESDPEDEVNVEGDWVHTAQVAALLSWALSGGTDRHSYPEPLGERDWGNASVSTTECVGLDSCPFAEQCRPAEAREIAAEAQIIVTNHSMLAVQAANDAPVVIGNQRLGQFDHVIVDEAHALPSIVRNQGAVEISGRKVTNLMYVLRGLMSEQATKTEKNLLDDGDRLAHSLDLHLEHICIDLKPGGVKRMADTDMDPLEGIGTAAEAWFKRVNRELGKISGSDRILLKVNRAKAQVGGLQAALRTVSEHEPGVARWFENTRPHAAAKNPKSHSIVCATPVNVAPMLKRNLWTRPSTDELAEEGERVNLSVIAVSATMPPGFAVQMGLDAPTREYESPFEAAYAASRLYVPRAVAEPDLRALCPASWESAKPRLDTRAHRDWALDHMKALVEANNGSALVLAATAEAGKMYAAELSKAARGRWEVLSQWDGDALRRTTAAWREDHHAVLVGTRSLMTGVDAPGDTCSLVILDRIPRAAGNPVDDARVDDIVARSKFSKWDADRLIYSMDAALLVSQAAGRLVRSMTDSGMVAVLDPRLLKVGPLAYNQSTRSVYLKALDHFENRISDSTEAVKWLEDRAAQRATPRAA